jgi:hypothetical protein
MKMENEVSDAQCLAGALPVVNARCYDWGGKKTHPMIRVERRFLPIGASMDDRRQNENFWRKMKGVKTRPFTGAREKKKVECEFIYLARGIVTPTLPWILRRLKSSR